MPVSQVCHSRKIKWMTRYGIMHKQGDILLVPIPFSDLTATKKDLC